MYNIPIEDKKEFLGWFLREHNLKKRECAGILNYLLSHENLLENVRFTDEAHYCPCAMVISTTKSESIPFRFYKGNLMTADAEKAFDSIKTKRYVNLYVQLNFPDKHKCVRYAGVHEENEFIPDAFKRNLSNIKIADDLINSHLEELKIKKLKMEIDKALDTENEKEFMRLSKKLSEFEGNF